jgi:hypothetical protein
VLFLPVRLETRFTVGKPELKVRIYPDAIHLDDHARELTEAEKAIGEGYWAAWNAAGDDEAARTAARDWLVGLLPARRAAWVARVTDPSSASPAAVATAARQARAACLPERWSVVGYVRDETGALVRRFALKTRTVAAGLGLGIDPESYGQTQVEGELPVDDRLKWMVDYDTAVAAGMALTIDLTKYEDVAANGLAVLLVVGLSGGDDADDHAALQSLLEAHCYAEGLAFAPQGTPTNNTDEVDSPWSFGEVDPAALLARELDGADAGGLSGSQSQRLGEALGLPNNPLLNRLEHAPLDEETPAKAMNRVLWPVTWGEYFNHLMVDEAGHEAVPSNAVADLKERFLADVRGGAALPCLRVGAQPYGVLPVRFTEPLAQWLDASPWFEQVLLHLRPKWIDAAGGAVPRLDPVLGASGGDASNDPDSVLTEILSSLPHPKRFLVRTLREWRRVDHTEDSLGTLFLGLILPFVYFDDPTYGYGALSVLGRWGWALEMLGGADFLGIPQSELTPLSAPSLRSADAQLEALSDLRGRVDSLLTSSTDRDSARAWIDAMSTLVEQHRERQAPYTELGVGITDFDGIVSNAVDDPKMFYSLYDSDSETPSFEQPLVHSDAATTSGYLSELKDRVPTLQLEPGATGAPFGGATPTGPVRVPARKSARSGKAARRGGRAAKRATAPVLGFEPVAVPMGAGLPDAFHAAEPLLYQLLDGVVDDVSALEGAAYRDALETLGALPEDELELRLRETLGLASHRLDAYVTSMARKRLGALRSEGTSLQLGGYGWVVDLAPQGKGALDSQGFIHAPSLEQATTAAILRSGWSVHGTEDDASAMAVDLAGDRVRLAAWLLGGVRQGQSLAELLGYRFERALQDDGLEGWIDPVRRAVLLSQGSSRGPRGPVDGLALLELYASKGSAAALVADVDPGYLPAGSSSDLTAPLDSLADALDAAGDAAIAESVHQVAQGNMTRAAATLDGINQGEVAPPELQSVRTPTAGVGVIHRLAVLLGDRAPATGWAGGTARAALDPELESWVGAVLGPADEVVLRVRFLGADGIAEDWQTLSMASLGFSALDAVFEAPGGAPTQDSRWGRRAVAWARDSRRASLSQDVTVEVDFEGAEGGVSAADWAEGARALRSLLGRARPLNARDLVSPDAEANTSEDVAELEARVLAAETTFRVAIASLSSLLPSASVTEETPHPQGTAGPSALRAAMMGLRDYVFLGALPTAGWKATDEDTAALWADAWALGDAAAARLASLDAAIAAWAEEDATTTEAPTDRKRLARAAKRIDAMVGRAFPVLPRFTPVDAAAMTGALSRSGALTGDDPAAIASFVSQVGHVRADTGLFDEVCALSQLLRNETVVPLQVGQLPEVAGEGWVATSLPAADTGGRVHWIAVDHGGVVLLSTGVGAGLMIDEWTEPIPKTTQTTGVALHFDAPSSRAPQALLLAVTPENRVWDFELLLSTLLQTLEDAQLRAVGPQTLAAYGHHLPAIFSPRPIDATPATAEEPQ